jgi:endo-1,4-beta-xylanase
MRQFVRTRPAAVITLLALLAGMSAVIAVPGLATRAGAADAPGVTSIDFEGTDFAPWAANGATVTIVEDSADPSNHVGAVSERGADTWRGITSPTGAFQEGVEYTFTARVRVSEDSSVRFIANEPGASNQWVWVGNITGVVGDWVTVTGTHTFGADAANAKVYVEASTTGDYEIDDISVTGTLPEEPEPCVPTTQTVSSVDFEDDTTGDWTQNGSPTLSYVTDGSRALSIARNQSYEGISLSGSHFDTGIQYTFSAQVKLASGEPDRGVRFVATNDSSVFDWIGNTTVNDDGFTTVTGTYTFTEEDLSGWKVYFGSEGDSTPYTILVDDLTVTYLGGCDEEEPEPCEPSTVTHSSTTFEGDSYGEWSPNGSPTLAFVPDPDDAGNTVLSVADRAAGYYGIQTATGAFEEGVLYSITARVRTDAADSTAHFTYNEPGASNEYAWVAATATGTSGEWVTMTGTFTPGENASSAKLYMEVEGGFDYLIDDIVITYSVPCGETPPPGTVLLNADFEDGTLQGWVAREASQGPHTVAVTSDDSHGGDYAALISDRTSQGSGIGFDVAGLLEPGTQYEMTAWVKFAGSPVEDIVFTAQTGASAFATLGTFTGVTNSSWTQVTTKFTFGTGDRAFLYFETPWEGADVTGNTTPFMIDDITVSVPDAVVIEDLTPIKDTVNFPVGVAIDQRETAGPSAELLLKHFNQITPENFMKPEAWYSGPFTWGPNSAEIDSLMNFAQDNDLGLYGHVLVWHSQTPAWFFQKSESDSTPLTTSEEDKQILRDRLHEHIFNVAEYLSDGWGEFGGGDNPVVAFDVVNEVIDDSSAYADGLRRSEWYRILGEEFIHLAFEYADDAFNDEYAADSADRPVALFINDYNTEQSGKRNRYLTLIDRLLDAGAPVDGIGHQFHVSLSMPVENLNAALSDASSFGLQQAVTEFDVTTGTPESEAKFIDQGYYYRDAFEIFRAHEDQMFSVTVWGLIDSRSWRDSNGGPLVFDDDFQAKPAYYGIVEGHTGDVEPPLPPRLRTADVFAGDVPVDLAATTSPQWDRLPLKQIAGNTAWQARWAADHLTVYVTVDDSTIDATDRVEFTVGDDEYYVERDGDTDVVAATTEDSSGWRVVAHVPLADAVLSDTVEFDVRASDDGDVVGWNSEGVLGTLTLVEELSFTEVGNAQLIPAVDGRKDWIWLHADTVTATKNVSGTGGALGTFYHLWSGNTLYIYAEIADPTVDVSGSDPWTQDSVEIYVDPGNVKNGSYRYDDTQIRINADNVVSFGTGDETFQANRVDSATKRVPGGYIVEASISLLEDGGLGSFQGVDFQVNDASGGTRTAIRNWADPTGAGYQSTARWGVAELVAAEPLDIPSDFPLEDEDLTDDNKRCVLAPSTAKPGQEIVIEVCPEYAGDTMDVYVYSVPQFSGSGVATGGFLTITLPSNLTAGIHKIAVYDEDGFLVGWTEITIVLADGAMADTGAHISGAAFLAVALVLAGAASLWTRRRLAPMLNR